LTVFSREKPRRLFFTPTALMGFALRSFLLATGIQCVSTSEGPTYRFSFQMLRLRRSARTERPRFLGLDPAESPSLLNLCLAGSTAGCSLGIRPFQGRSAEGFHRAAHPAILSRASRPLPRDSSDAPQSFSTSTQSRPASDKRWTTTTTLIGFWYRHNPKHSDGQPGGLWIHLTPQPSHC